MLPDEVKVNFTIRPKLLLVSPLAALAVFGLFLLPWGADSAPAWVQAIGSIAAIFVAWMIPHFHERARLAREKSDIYDSAGWLALRIKNQLGAIERVLERAAEEDDPPAVVSRWLNAGGPAECAMHKQAADELPISAFCGSDISFLIGIRSAAEFASECSEVLSTWDFEAIPDITRHFPLHERLSSARARIEWAMRHTHSRPGSGIKNANAG